MTEKLALLGGASLRSAPFPEYRTIGEEEKAAVLEVMDSGVLSSFLGTWSPDFYGGPRVRRLEEAWSRYFEVAHAVSVNSATSGLYAAVGAAGVGPGDEVIVSPYTMSASAAAALVYGAVPVFADIDPETFCLSPESIAERITSRTRAIIVVDIFGHPAAMEAIMALAARHGLTVIEDCAQAPGAKRNGRWAGTLGHMGVYSLNYHKTIHCGEGGVVVTDDPDLAERLQLIRNHAEAVVKAKGVKNLANLVGFNYRMTEIEAAIAAEQLKKLDRLVAARRANAEILTEGIKGLPGLIPPAMEPGCDHGWYVYAMKLDVKAVGIPRRRLVEALRAEGMVVAEGYVEPLYLQPMYQEKVALGAHGFPFQQGDGSSSGSYDRGLCPVTERMHFEELIYTPLVHASLTAADMEDIVAIVRKVWAGLEQLKGREA